MQARDIMTTPVITVTPDTLVADVARLLLERGISAAPVVGADGGLVGIVSEGDLVGRPETGAEERRSWWLRLLAGPQDTARDYVRIHGRRVADVMTREVRTVTEEASITEVTRLLETHRIKRVPVVRDGRVVGIVSRADLLRGFGSRQPPPAVAADDRALRARVLAALRDAGAAPGLVNVVASDGVVHLWGAVDSEEQRQACRVAAENVPGVRGVDNHLGVVRLRGV
jgi:CBS domain-containing protein